MICVHLITGTKVTLIQAQQTIYSFKIGSTIHLQHHLDGIWANNKGLIVQLTTGHEFLWWKMWYGRSSSLKVGDWNSLTAELKMAETRSISCISYRCQTKPDTEKNLFIKHATITGKSHIFLRFPPGSISRGNEAWPSQSSKLRTAASCCAHNCPLT